MKKQNVKQSCNQLIIYRDLCPNFIRPNRIERIPKLDASFAHVKDEHGQTTNSNTAKLFPITS
jgi:hypothetical protein